MRDQETSENDVFFLIGSLNTSLVVQFLSLLAVVVAVVTAKLVENNSHKGGR